jgi:hypothetical protein
MICRLIAPPSSAPCGAPATRRVTFVDGDQTPACEECALRLEMLAQSHGTSVRVERIDAANA